MLNRRAIAYFISRILGPMPLLCLLWLVTALKSGIGFGKALWVYPLIFLATIATFTLFTSRLILAKKVKSIEWPDIKERKKYLPAVSAAEVGVLITLTYLLTNQTVFHLSLLLSAILLAVVFLWAFANFKISGHAAVATITFAGVNLFFHLQFLWLFLLLVPIVWARLELKLHTPKQLAAGIFLPLIFMGLSLLLFGYPAVP